MTLRTRAVASAASLAVALAAALAIACGGAPTAQATPSAAVAIETAVPSPDRPELLLATTTSTQDSGLLDVLIPDFERRTGYKVKTTAVGSGAALALGARGDADALLVHAISAELEFMAAGNGERRLLVMHNDFVLAGPPADPAGAKGKPILDALRAIAAARATFISRGDRSGTDVLEKDLFKRAGAATSGPWYVESGTGMGQSLTVASERRGYILADRATFLARRGALALEIAVEGGAELVNPYHVITVHATRFPRVNRRGADALAEYLVSRGGQKLIGEFGRERFGQPLFFADAGKRVEDLR